MLKPQAAIRTLVLSLSSPLSQLWFIDNLPVNIYSPSITIDLTNYITFFLHLFFIFDRYPASTNTNKRGPPGSRSTAEASIVFDYVAYFEKPALLYGAQAMSFKVFGVNEFSARRPSTLAALGGIAVTGLLGAFMYGRGTGILASVVVSLTR